MSLTARYLPKRTKKHQPGWLKREENGCTCSSILTHLLKSGHPMEPDNAFLVACILLLQYVGAVRSRTLETTGAINTSSSLKSVLKLTQWMSWKFRGYRLTKTLAIPLTVQVVDCHVSTRLNFTPLVCVNHCACRLTDRITSRLGTH